MSPQDEAAALFDQVDTDKDGVITYKEWQDREMSQQRNPFDLGKFLRGDTNSDRTIDRQEFLRYYMTNHGQV
ncbi:hypothetical protein [Streptomyces sp. NPDC017993]|uniref:hypothetical protein n=1 Tax=Streptomyces sp. NPDC017993 TaxID=3365027 RepID=UPI0037B5E56C